MGGVLQPPDPLIGAPVESVEDAHPETLSLLE